MICAALCALAMCLPVASVRVAAVEPSVFQDGNFHVVDFGTTQMDLGSFATYAEADRFFEKQKEFYENTGIVKDGITYRAEYAIALFHTDEACDFQVAYTALEDEDTGTLNGCYGVDAAYIDTNAAGDRVTFAIAGLKAEASLTDLTIVPINNLTTRLSTYTVTEGNLFHQIKKDMQEEDFAYWIEAGKAPDFLTEGNLYYSYDGHYFYDENSLYALLDDLHTATHDHAVNPDNPWYNYYQFVSHRTITSVGYKQGEQYVASAMDAHGPIVDYVDLNLDGADDTLTRTQYYGVMPAFWQYQYEYGANALMMLALSVNESMNGHSSLSYSRNNLYGHAAYDSDVEAAASRYLQISNSIYAHAKYYISGTYSSPLKAQFHGSFFGNKSAGMNVNYSDDPYWGEKAASRYYLLDRDLGGADFNRYALGIRSVKGETKVYDAPDGNVLYTTGQAPDMAFVILGTDASGLWWKVQSEATLSDDAAVDLHYRYNFTTDVGFIRMSDIQIKTEGTLSGEETYHAVSFDAAGGTFAGGEPIVSYLIEDGADAAAVAPRKDHALFDGWSASTDALTEDNAFEAKYKDVDRIEMKQTPKTDYELNDRVNLQDGKITVYFKDGTEHDVSLTSSMVSGFDLATAGEQEVTVSYAGCTLTYPISVSQEKDDTRTEIKKEIMQAIEQYSEVDALTDADVEIILALKKKIDDMVLPYLTQAQLREFDRIMRKTYDERIRYIVNPNQYDLGVSGLGISIPLGNSLKKNRFVRDTYRVLIHQGVQADARDALAHQAVFARQDVVDTFTIRMLKNYTDATAKEDLVFSIRKPEDAQLGDVYTVLEYTESGEVVSCYTRQTTGMITFMARNPGPFLLMKQSSGNQYAGADPVEVVTHETSSFDMEHMLIAVSFAAGVIAILLAVIIRFLWQFQKKRRKKHQQEAQKEMEKLEVTQAIHILDTQVLSTEEIQKAAAKEDRKNDQHHRSA